jgi:hypothetical protein
MLLPAEVIELAQNVLGPAIADGAVDCAGWKDDSRNNDSGAPKIARNEILE